jgi:hypothetical protein
MITGMQTYGLEDALEFLQRDLKRSARALTYRGLVRAGLLIARDAIRMAPIDTGNLRASCYVIGKNEKGQVSQRKEAKGKVERGWFEREHVGSEYVAEKNDFHRLKEDVAVQVGFTASYAAAVHEGDPTFNWHKGAPQFLHNSLTLNHTNVLKLATEEVRKIERVKIKPVVKVGSKP